MNSRVSHYAIFQWYIIVAHKPFDWLKLLENLKNRKWSKHFCYSSGQLQTAEIRPVEASPKQTHSYKMAIVSLSRNSKSSLKKHKSQNTQDKISSNKICDIHEKQLIKGVRKIYTSLKKMVNFTITVSRLILS